MTSDARDKNLFASAGVSAPADPLIARFVDYLSAQKNCSPLTVKSYLADIHALDDAARALTSPRTLATLSPTEARALALRLRARGLSARTVASVLSSWRAFYRWGTRFADLTVNPVDGLRAPKANKPLPKALSVDQAMALFDRVEVADDDLEGVRDRAMFELMYATGLRLSELIGLDVAPSAKSRGHVDAAQALVSVTGKGDKQRQVPVGARALKALAAWMQVRAQCKGAEGAALFLSPRGARISPTLVSQRLKRWTQRSGVPAHVHPHVLRHSFASHVLQGSQDLRGVQELLGHESIASTQVYTHLDFQALSKVYDAAHPRARRKET